MLRASFKTEPGMKHGGNMSLRKAMLTQDSRHTLLWCVCQVLFGLVGLFRFPSVLSFRTFLSSVVFTTYVQWLLGLRLTTWRRLVYQQTRTVQRSWFRKATSASCEPYDHISSHEHAWLKSCKAQDCTSLCP